jgi:hypothetical protein
MGVVDLVKDPSRFAPNLVQPISDFGQDKNRTVLERIAGRRSIRDS